MLTNTEIEAIRKRAEKAAEGNPLKDTYVLARMDRVILEDIPTLLAEIKELRAEISRLCPIGDLDTIATLQTDIAYRDDIIKEKDAEIDRMRASVEKAKQIVGNLTYENAILKGERPITVHLNGGDE